MKKLIIALALGLGLTGFAQETAPQQKKTKTEKMTPEQRQQKHVELLTKELALDANQQKAVGKILVEKSAKVKDLKAKKANEDKMTPEEKTALKNKLQAEKADVESKMKAVLTSEQYQKWLTLKDKNKEKTKEKKGVMEKVTSEKQQQKFLAHLTKKLTLDAKQQEAIGKILAEKSAKAKELKTQKETQKAKGEKMSAEEKTALKNKMQAEKADTEARMKAILSADQYQKWLTVRDENKEKAKEKKAK